MQYEQELEKLNEDQRAAVYDFSNACLVNANVGSGKTTVLIAKIIYLHYEKQVPYQNMVVLTFTNKAANEIKERLLALEPELSKEELRWFGTFHSVALAMLKAQPDAQEFLVIEPEEALVIAQQLIVEHSLTIKYKNRLKKRLETAKSITDPDKQISKYQDDLFVLLSLLEEEKRRQNKMDFDDLISNATSLAKENAQYPDWIIIDEVQDSDLRQLEFIDALKGKDTHLFAVGDPNQVIYSFRGGASMVFYKLKQKYQAKELSLPLNYRSSAAILQAARCFLQQGGKITGVREQGAPIVVKNHYDSFQEACYLADRIRQLHKEGIPYREIAVFYRVQSQSKAFEDVFCKEQIPYEVSLKKTVKDIPVLNWFIKLMRFCVNPQDITAGMAVLSDTYYGTSLTEKEALYLLRDKDSKSATSDGPKKQAISEKKGLRGRELLERMSSFTAWLQTQDTALNYELLDSYFEFDYYLHPTSMSYQEDKQAITELVSIIADYGKEHDLTSIDGLREFLNTSSLYGINILQKEIMKDSDSVKLMTLHASKGLEFSHVFITGVNYGLIPLQTKSFEEDEEEQRLFFVGITRAKDYLELSYYTKADQYRVMAGPSRYLRMIPEKLLAKDESEKHEVSLQELKKQVLKARETKDVREPEPAMVPKEPEIVLNEPEMVPNESEEVAIEEKAKPEESPAKTRVKHPNYGEGTVVKEDDVMITVDFDDYGEKEFVKAFAGFL